MEFKKLLHKVHDKVSHTSTSAIPVPNSAPIRRRSFKDKKQATLSRWRDRWGDVSRPRFFSSSNNNNNRTNRNDVFGPPLPTSAAALASPPTCSYQVPTITVSSPTLLKRSQSTTSPHRTHPKSHYFVHQKQRPISYSPSALSPQKKHQRLSVPHVPGRLQSPCLSPYDSAYSFDEDDDYSNEDALSEEEDASSFYHLPVLGAPPRQVTWYVPEADCEPRFDSPCLDQDSIQSTSTTFLKSSLSSSSSSCSSTTSSSTTSLVIEGALSKSYPTIDRHVTPQLRGSDSAFLSQEEQLKEGTDNDPFLSPTNTTQETLPHHQLTILAVANVMMTMREHQLELRMAETRIENQRLHQQMDDMISGTWTSTNHLLAENDRLEVQIQHLQKQQRLVRSSIINSEQVYLRKNVGEPDVLDRFKKLLASYG